MIIYCLEKVLHKVKHFIDYLRLEQSMSDNSVVAYAHDIEMFWDFLNGVNKYTSLKDIQQEDIEAFFANLYDLGLSASSQARILSGIKKFYAYLIQEKIVAEFDSKIEAASADYQELARLLEEKEEAEMLLMELMEQWEAAQE